ncbi:MAG: hypothetical protein RLZZ453_1178 [Chlamydiota bacterium]|jgi:hypothetical protein
MNVRPSSPQKEGLLQVSKWLKLQVLLDPLELKELLELLSPCHLLNTSEPVEQEEIPLHQFYQTYTDYVQGKTLNFRSVALSKTLSCFYALPLKEGKFLIKPTHPVIQVQSHAFFFSSVDHRFHPMVQSKESIPWGVQFSYPQLFFDKNQNAIISTKSEQNTPLFRTLMQWIRSHSIPTTFIVNGNKQTTPIRIGRKALLWANELPALKAHNLLLKKTASE